MSSSATENPQWQLARIDRLIGIAKLWAAVKFFHPYLAYRDNIDWDAALIKAIPKVDAAHTPAEYSAAIESMLNELDDPATHVLTAPSPAPAVNSSSPAERQPTFRRNPDGVLVRGSKDSRRADRAVTRTPSSAVAAEGERWEAQERKKTRARTGRK
jgi:hypothetical protein